jgi:hypothetical protein
MFNQQKSLGFLVNTDIIVSPGWIIHLNGDLLAFASLKSGHSYIICQQSNNRDFVSSSLSSCIFFNFQISPA